MPGLAASPPQRYGAPSTDKDTLRCIGYVIASGSVLFGMFFFYAVFLSQGQPPASDVIDTQKNNYYILLLPVLVPTMITFSWINWMGMQSFRRN